MQPCPGPDQGQPVLQPLWVTESIGVNTLFGRRVISCVLTLERQHIAMKEYPAPDWLRVRQVTDAEYASWLNGQTSSIWKRERRSGKRAHATPSDLKQALHKAAHKSDGHDPYTGNRLFVDHLRAGWTDPQASLNGNRHHLTLRRCMPSFDHVRGVGRSKYELCTRETNAAKSFMSPAQFIDLCGRVTSHQHQKASAAAA